MYRVGRSWFAAAFIAVAFLVACEPVQRAGPPDKCARYNGGLFSRLKGNLHGQQAKARAIARRMRAVGQGVAHPSQPLTLTAICENHELDNNHLREGRFVGILTGPGTAPEYSRIANDTVLWWVFGEVIELPNGQDTVVHYSQFLSLGAQPGTPYTVTMALRVCPTDTRGGERQERVDWHEAVCDTSATHMPGTQAARTQNGSPQPQPLTVRRGDRPWFGCTRGCCFAQVIADTEGGSEPTDPAPRDTSR